MAKTHTIDGKTYVEVERKADVGEKIVNITECDDLELRIGQIISDVSVDADGFVDYNFGGISPRNYRVLEPVAEEWPPLTEESIELTANDIRWQPDKVIDLLANLARRVSSLERQNDDRLEALEEQALRITSLERQLSDTQNNVIRQAEELAANEHSISELYDRLAHVEADVERVEERTANHRDELNVIDHEKAMIFEDIVSLSKRIKKLNGGAAE